MNEQTEARSLQSAAWIVVVLLIGAFIALLAPRIASGIDGADEGTFSCRASAVRLDLGALGRPEPVVANAQLTECENSTPPAVPESSSPPTQGLTVTAKGASAKTDIQADSTLPSFGATAEAGIMEVTIATPNGTLGVKVANSRATALCPGNGALPVLEGSSKVTSVTMNGVELLPAELAGSQEIKSPLPSALNFGRIFVNRQTRETRVSDGRSTLTQHALYYETNKGADVIVGESVVGYTHNPCPDTPPVPPITTTAPPIITPPTLPPTTTSTVPPTPRVPPITTPPAPSIITPPAEPPITTPPTEPPTTTTTTTTIEPPTTTDTTKPPTTTDTRQLSISDVRVGEGRSGTTNATFTVTLSSAASQQVQVDFNTVDGSATAPDDYAGTAGTVRFRVGETRRTIVVSAIGDTVAEPDETFSVNLTNPAGAAVADGRGEGTIVNDDAVARAANTTNGYWIVARDGGVFSFGDAVFRGPAGKLRLNHPIVAMTSTPTGNGYYLVASDGGIFAFGDAVFRGSTGHIRLNQPIVGMTTTPTGKGYWLVARDGGIFAFGDAVFRGSTGALRLNEPIVAMASTPAGNGYWLVASDGGIFAFGDAVFRGSTATARLARPIVGMAATTSGSGYHLVASDGGIFAFGDAVFRGSTGALRLSSPIVGMARTASGSGYHLVAADGGVFAFGDAVFRGSTGNLDPAQPVVGMAPLP